MGPETDEASRGGDPGPTKVCREKTQGQSVHAPVDGVWWRLQVYADQANPNREKTADRKHI